jgi:uncharacterized delta-60 repeat protein
VATYNGVGAGSNAPKNCLIDKFGNIIVAGRSENLSFNDDFITLKYNSSGNLLWERRYNGVGNGDDAIAAAVLDDSGNIYVTGYSQEGASLGGYNWITIKYFSNGVTAWKRSFNWTANSTDEPFAMAIDKFNNIYISGYGRTGLPFDDDFITIKYNSDGIQQWIKVYASIYLNSDRSNSIIVDDSCNVYPSGYGSTEDGNEIITIKYAATGEEIWIRRFPTNYADFLRHTLSAKDKYNNIIVNGYYYIGEHYAFNTIKYNSSGEILWNRIYKGAGNLNFCFALCTDDSANVYAAGRSQNAGTDADFVIIKYNQSGDTMWIRNYDSGENGNDYANGIAVDNFQNVYLTGRSYYELTGLDYVTIKYNKVGKLLWTKRYIGIGIGSIQDISYSIALDNTGSVIITGNSDITNSSNGIVTIKYSQPTGVNSNIFSDSKEDLLYQNYPNPFNGSSKITFKVNISSTVCIKVFNITGEQIKILIDKNLLPGMYNVDFKGENLASGIYYYSLFINGILANSKKLLIIK